MNRAPQWLVRSHGRDGIEQEAWVAVCKAAHDFDPVKRPGVPFGAFARIGVRRHLMDVRERTGIKLGVWQAPPLDRDGEPFLDPADHRREWCDPALRAWCSPDYAAQRRCLDWRARLILYLRFVEGWTLEEVGDALGMVRERVRQLEERAGCKLAAFRTRTLIRRQLRGSQT